MDGMVLWVGRDNAQEQNSKLLVWIRNFSSENTFWIAEQGTAVMKMKKKNVEERQSWNRESFNRAGFMSRLQTHEFESYKFTRDIF
ncbi:hypothetical protein Y1Q_0007771 [Alligator mississippiensis]|uniref:Uncharacterized protein n=1 Tax=Alligator mississippiensis TaxID=8496 RepID=A0A151N6W1_ALLMI|nr:hypothetical protein Y1Q_0007771 [Alligator mississippiensis]